MPAKFINIDRDTRMLFPEDMRDWLPEGHLVHFIVEVVESLDMTAFEVNVRGTGSEQYPPSMMLTLLIYCYATGRFSSREIEQASWCDVAVRYICAQTHPDHDTICNFRRRNRQAFEKFFVQVLEVAAASKVMRRVGTVSIDGTKIHANASKHSAMSYGHAQKIFEKLENEVAILMQKAEQADAQSVPCELDLPDEISRRENRRAQIKQAMEVIESRHREKLAQQQRQYEQKLEGWQQRGGRGKKPQEPSKEVNPKDQYNFTDPQSHIMKAGTGGHFEQCYNAQAGVDTETMLVVANHLSDHATDKQELNTCIDKLIANGYKPDAVLADNGYYSEKEVEQAQSKGVEAYIAVKKHRHGKSLEDVLGEKTVTPLNADASAREVMEHKLETPHGKELYRQRKYTVEPVFGIIKQCMGFRQFLTRGKENVSNEWNLVCSAYNMKRMFRLIRKQQAVAMPAATCGA